MATKKPSNVKLPKLPSGNQAVEELEEIQAAMAAMQQKAAAAAKAIREGMKDVVVLFVDMVDSTKFKVEVKGTPERWILRVKQFSEILTEYIERLGGKVVKYIGDEVMAVFDAPSMVTDAMNFVVRVEEIEKNLHAVTGVETRIKVVVDKGSVYLLKFEGHDEEDPQGSPVDRCARIGKFAQPGTVLSSFDFVKECGGLYNWKSVGSTELKGLGPVGIYQLGVTTVSLAKKVEIAEDELSALKSENEKLTLEKAQLVQMNQSLQEQLKELGEKPKPGSSVSESTDSDEASDEAWSVIDGKLGELRSLIETSGVPSNEYARFIFLHMQGEGQTYNKFERTFDASIEHKLVYAQEGGSYYLLDTSHKRNKKVLAITEELQDLLTEFEQEHGTDEDHLFDYSLDEPKFWKKVVGYTVS